MESLDLKQEYFLEGSDIGCLVIHGFTGTPAELRELGGLLHTEGYTVKGVRLKGHGTSISEMEKCKYTDWIKSVEEGYEELRSCCSQVYVIGHSMGGALALYIAEQCAVDKVVALAPALVNKDKSSRFVPIAKYFMRYTEWKPVERPEGESKYLLGYEKIPLHSVHELIKLQRVVRKNLKRINRPLLIIHTSKDQAIDEKGIELLKTGVTSKEIKAIYLHNCGHNITVECEKETVFKEVINFLR